MPAAYQPDRVPVAGGDLAVARWGTGDQLVFASHGITANHRSFTAVAEALVTQSGHSLSLVALGHRGRAASANVDGPFGLTVHADDVIAVMDHYGAAQAVLVGHSMGGFVVANAAERHPDRVSRLVLVDGGLPFPAATWVPGDELIASAPVVPADHDQAAVEAAIHAVIGPALARLDLHWDSEDDYVEFFRNHPAFQPPNQWTSTVEDYLRFDAVIDPAGQIRSSVNKAAVLVDGAAAIVDPVAAAAATRITTPSALLWCPRGLLDQTPGLYPPGFAAAVADRFDHLDAQEVVDTNHYTVMTTDAGAKVVAAAVISAVSADQPAPGSG